MSTSRERKARIYDGITVALFLIFMVAFGCLLGLAYAPKAKAEPDSVVVAYAATYGGAVCSTLDDYPSFSGIIGIGQAIADDGLSFYQAGEVIALSVLDICPRHTALMDRFSEAYGHTARSIA